MGTMQKIVTIFTVTILGISGLTGCTSATNEANVSRQEESYQIAKTKTQQLSEKSTTESGTAEEKELESFEQLVDFIENDKNITDTMMYSIYIEKVYCTAEYDETEIVVVCKGLDSDTDVSYETTMAAEKDFREYYREGGIPFESVENWYKQGIPYTAESIIDICLEESGYTAEELKPYDQITLVSTFK